MKSRIRKYIALLRGDFAIVTLAELLSVWACGFVPGLLLGAVATWLILRR